jgi:hypothetical protein
MDEESPPLSVVRLSTDTVLCSSFDPTDGVRTRGVIAVSVALSSRAVHVVWEANQAPSPSTFRVFYRRGRLVDTEVKEDLTTPPPFAQLRQNYPNPFNPSTTIGFRILVSGFTTLNVYDVLGREVAALVNERKMAGDHVVEWRTGGLPSGVYYYRLVAGSTVETRKAILIR